MSDVPLLPEELSYFLPPFGTLRPKMFDESMKVYGQLFPKEVERLKSIPQLGIVSRAWAGARHTRWDYVMLTMHITRQARATLSMGSEVSLPNGSEISSSQELMNCWTLLLHLGHMYWTFTTERWLLDELTQHEPFSKSAIDALISHVPDDLHKWAQDVFKNRLYYEFYKVLAFYRLQQLAKDDHQAAQWRQMLHLYIEPGDHQSTAWNARRNFRRIRRLAFLALDAEYSPSALTLRMQRLLTDTSQLGQILSVDPAHPNDQLIGLQRYLKRHIYLGEPSLREAAVLEGTVRRQIREELANDRLEDVVAALAMGDSPDDPRGDNDVALRLEIPDYALLVRRGRTAFDPIRQTRIAERWTRKHELSLRLTHNSDSSRRLHVLQAHAAADDVIARAGAVAYGLNGLVWLAESLEDTQVVFLQRFGLQDAIEGLITASLKVCFAELSCEWRVSQTRALFGLVGSKQHLASLLQTEEMTRGLSESETAEVEAVADCARKMLGVTAQLVVVGNVEAIQKSGSALLEMDGLVVSLLRSTSELVVTVIEAKRKTRSAETAARKDLREKVKRLTVGNGIRGGRVRSRRLNRREAYAYCHFRVVWSRN